MNKLRGLLLVSMFSFLALVLVGCSCQNNKTFTVTFDSNGGSEVEKQEVKLNEKVEEPEDPTKEGYTFKGWYLSGKKYDFDKKVTKDIKLKARWTKIAVEDTNNIVDSTVINTMTNVALPQPTPVIVKKAALMALELPEVFYLNTETTFKVNVTANDYANTIVVGKTIMSDIEALEKLEYLGADGNWYELSLEENFGGEEGFALVDGTNEFRATFNKTGEYEVTVKLLSVSDNKLMAETTTTLTVEKKKAELNFDLPEIIYLNEATEFAITTTAYDYAGIKVVGKATISDTEALEKLEYLGADGNWYELSLEQDFGQSEGFALEDATSDFKATFNKVGEYEVTVKLLNVEDQSVVAETTTTIVVEKKNAEVNFELPEEFVVGQTQEFTLSTIANDYENLMVVGKATISDIEALEKLEYLGADGNWYELSLEENFGGEEGFALVDGTNEFRATFNKAGEYEVTVKLLSAEDQSVVAEAETTVTVREPIAAEVNFELPEEFVVGQAQEFTIAIIANDYENLMVVGKATISDIEALEKLEYLGADGNWYELSLEENFGGEEGFALVDGTNEFRATFNKVGEYEITVKLLNVEDQSIVSETETKITVREPIAAEVNFELPEEFVVGQTQEFTVSTIANDYENLMVVGTGGLSNPEAIEKLEYYEVKDGNWYELPADSDFGGTTGFPLTDATSKFKVTFSEAGTYIVDFKVINAETREDVACASTEIEVVEAIVVAE